VKLAPSAIRVGPTVSAIARADLAVEDRWLSRNTHGGEMEVDGTLYYPGRPDGSPTSPMSLCHWVRARLSGLSGLAGRVGHSMVGPRLEWRDRILRLTPGKTQDPRSACNRRLWIETRLPAKVFSNSRRVD